MIRLKPNHIEDYLMKLHQGQWFSWSDPSNKVYENLIILDDSKTKPTEQECIDGLAQLVADFDARIDLRASAKAKLIAGEALTEDEANVLIGG
jgi:hypothetical protein